MIKLYALLAGIVAVVAAADVEVDYRVPVKIIFRAFCPACQWFISDPVLALLQDDKFRAVTKIQYVPAAAMTESADGGVECVGGKAECDAHLWMACILDRFKASPKNTSTHMACFESDDSGYTWSDKIAFCFKDAADATALHECKTGHGINLLRELMVVAKAFEGAWQPYTIIEDTLLGSSTSAVTLDMLQDEICRRYKGPAELLPAYCQTVAGVVMRTPPPLLVPQQLQPVAEKVKVQVIWRAYCPACKWFLSGPLYEVLSDPAFQAIVDFELYPSGTTTEVSPGAFKCIGGQSECVGHLYMSCALRLFPQIHDVAANLKCMEDSHHKWERRMSTCFSGSALDQIKACFASNDSKQYLREYIAFTSTIDLPWVPFVRHTSPP
ncbi:hypothetical protein, variant 3 [Aphanomyces astaci]|uniref:Saposin A-type domain-containing protein n=1 Tax=Aphanomyces astaci TaxID=112090 RepID=W4GQ81_APHAT|nr:hypothetical protein, variant 3 [Aphanomyces astaci]ETV81867.1 hypothetical protein, variant 3 [Aphanomyces astaci]|eukprot:XP_009828604.1 hypothetical protein, variant 3 [Aphanomyces astaci]